jgi:hypothetical protein
MIHEKKEHRGRPSEKPIEIANNLLELMMNLYGIMI